MTLWKPNQIVQNQQVISTWTCLMTMLPQFPLRFNDKIKFKVWLEINDYKDSFENPSNE